MKRLFGFGVVALAAALIAGNASAQTTGDELKCQLNASKVVAKFAGSKVKCLNKCWAGIRKGDPNDCQDTAQDSDPRDATTQACIDAAEAKSNSGQAKKCTADCPECYDGGNCTADASGKTTTAEGLIDGQDPAVHCNNGETGDAGKCQDNTGKVLTKWVAALSKCTQKCKANEDKGKAAPGSCDPPASDPATIACINAGEAKCVSGVNKKCGDAGATPACWGAGLNEGSEWCNLVQGIVDGQYTEFFCGSPSGAFLE